MPANIIASLMNTCVNEETSAVLSLSSASHSLRVVLLVTFANEHHAWLGKKRSHARASVHLCVCMCVRACSGVVSNRHCSRDYRKVIRF